jgi:hypothetical protein
MEDKSFQRGLLWWATYPGKKKWNVLKRQHDKAWKHTIQEMEAQRSVRKEIGLEGEQGLKSTLDRR